jgi:hypothetical protein
MYPLTRSTSRFRFFGGGYNAFSQLGPTLDLSFAGTVTDTNDPNGYTLNTNFITPQYQVAAQYTIWETNVGLVNKNFSDIITFTRASTATYFDSTGTLQSAAIDAPRLDYNPSTLAAQGLLIEESRTNLCLQSEDFATTWTVAGTATITTNQLTSPAGTLTADLLTTPSLGTNRVQQAGTAVVSTTYAASVFVKAGNINGLTFRLFFSGGTSVDTYADFIFSSATFSGVNGAGVFSAQNCGNGWYRITCVVASGNNTAWDMRVGGLISTAQTGTTAYVWGAQLEAGAFPTSYIPTTTTALTRAADVASVNTLSPWFNSASGTLYVEGQLATGINPATPAALVSLDDTTLSNRMQLRRQSGGIVGDFRFVSSGGNFTGTATVGTLTGINKQAAAYAVSDQSGVVNGTLMTGITPVATLPTITRLVLGDGPGSTPLNGWLRRVTFYPRRLSNAELQTITS